jgi:hypothetical protein
MAWPVGQQFLEHLGRTEPGRGASLEDDLHPGEVKVKLRSIPNVATPRLKRRLDVVHQEVHTPEGLRAWDASRRSLVEKSLQTRAITHELRLRGESTGSCPHCWGQRR